MAFCKLYNMKDLTEGKPIKVIWLYALPMILGQIAQQFYSFCDSAIVGNCINPDALAAVGATNVISNTLIGFLNSATLGLSIPIARYFGAQDQKNMRKCIGVSAILTFVTSIVLTIVGLLFIYDLLVLLGTPEEIIHMADKYVKYILAGLIFSAIYNFGANLLRAVGDSKTPLIFLGIAVVLNIGLDLLFIQGFHSGVAGAAIATVISQAVAGVACFIYIFTKCDFLIPKKDEYRVDHTDFSDLVQSALAMGFMSCIVNIGTVTLQSSINKLGTNIITAHTAARKIFDILDVALYIIGNAVTTFVSQNIGAKRIDRVKSGIRAGILINTIATTLIILVGFRNKRRSCNRSSCYVYPNQHVLFLCTRTIVRTSLCYAGYGKKDCSRAFQYDRNGRKDPCCYVLGTCPRISGRSDHRTYHLGCLHADAYHYVCRKAC